MVLLDEYQDTCHAQLRLLSALFGGGHAVTAVGDPYQSIYGWRGASAGSLDRFPASSAPTTARPRALALTTSWRNDRRPRRGEHRLGPAARARRTASATCPPSGAGPAPGPASAGLYADRRGRGARGRRLPSRRGWPRRPAAADTAAVLCRTSAASSPTVVAALRGRGLPVEVVGLGGLLDTPGGRRPVALPEVVARPDRGDALMRLLTGPAWRARTCTRSDRGRSCTGGPARGRPRAAPTRTPPRSRGARRGARPALAEAWSARAGERLPSRPRSASARARRRCCGRLRSRSDLPLPDLVADVEQPARPGHRGRRRAPGRRRPGAARTWTRSATSPPRSPPTATGPTLAAFLAWLDAAEDEERGLDARSASPTADAVADPHRARRQGPGVGRRRGARAGRGRSRDSTATTVAPTRRWLDGRGRAALPAARRRGRPARRSHGRRGRPSRTSPTRWSPPRASAGRTRWPRSGGSPTSR